MKKLFFRFLSIILLASLGGCIVNPLVAIVNPERDSPAFWETYNKRTAELDQMAKDGKITWVTAATLRRDADKALANNTAGYYTSWKFDMNDEEFHAYCIAIAERLDKRQITFAQYDSARIAKFNEIRERGSLQATQAEMLRIQRNNQLLLQQQQQQQQLQMNQNRTFNCDTFGSTTTCR